MIQPLSVLLAAVEPSLPAELVSRTARQALRKRAAQVPGDWASGCVECRLTRDEDNCDLLVYATSGEGGQRALAKTVRGAGGAAFGRSLPFLTEWTRRGSSLGREAAAVWLEYDLPQKGKPPDPFAFVCLYPDYLRDGYPLHRPRRPQSAKRVRRTASMGLGYSLGREVSARQLDVIERCAARLPMKGRLLHVVGMPDRPGSSLRVGAIVPAPQLEAWLDGIGWPGARRQLGRLMRVIGAGYDYLHAQVEVSDEVEPRLALDFNLELAPSESSRWSGFVDRLVGVTDCEKPRAHAALGWVKSRRVAFPPERLPARLDHQLFFKVTATPDDLQAKAYLCFQPRYALL